MLKKRFGMVSGSIFILLALSTMAVTGNGNSALVRASFPENNDKKIITAAEWRNPPISFTRIKLGDREVKLKEEFENGDDLIKGLTITVKNVSDKDIKYLEFHLMFPETGSYEFAMTAGVFKFGRYRGIWEHGENATLKPGDETEFRITNERYAEIKRDMEQQRKAHGGEQPALINLTHMELLLQMVMFADDTMYYGEYMHRKSPDSNEFVPN